MRKLLLALGLLLGGVAHAQWVEILPAEPAGNCTEEASRVFVALDKRQPGSCVGGVWSFGFPCDVDTESCALFLPNETVAPPCDGGDFWFTFVSGVLSGCSNSTALTIATGAHSNSFVTMDASSGTDPVADTTTDTLVMTGTAPITVTGSAAGDSLTFAISLHAGTDPTADLEEEGSLNATAVTGNASAASQIIRSSAANAAAWVTLHAGTDPTADLEEEAQIAGTAITGNGTAGAMIVGTGANTAAWKAGSTTDGTMRWCDPSDAAKDIGDECCALYNQTCKTTQDMGDPAAVAACDVDHVATIYMALCY